MSTIQSKIKLSAKAKKGYQSPQLMWLGEIAKGSGVCDTGSANSGGGTCTHGPGAAPSGCNTGGIAGPLACGVGGTFTG
jgi:hypothetical protein